MWTPSSSGLASLARVSPSLASYWSFHTFLFIFKFKFLFCCFASVSPRQSWVPFGAEADLELVTVLLCQPLCFPLTTSTSSVTPGFGLFCPCLFHWKHPGRGMADPLPVLLFHFLSSVVASHCSPVNCPLLWPGGILGILLTDYSSRLLPPLRTDHTTAASSQLCLLGHEGFLFPSLPRDLCRCPDFRSQPPAARLNCMTFCVSQLRSTLLLQFQSLSWLFRGAPAHP